MARRGKAKRTMKRSGSKYQKVLVDAQAMRQLQVYRYPFSVATSQPKIPDGCNTQTLGIKLQKQYKATSDAVLFVLLPVYGSLLRIKFKDLENDDVRVVHNVRHDDGIKPFEMAEDGGNIAFTHVDAYSAYRLVSAGLRLKLISNDNENDGYWEAIRFNLNELSGHYHLSTLTDPADAQGDVPIGAEEHIGTFHVLDSFLNHLFNKSNWLNNPTYQMGKLKSLSQFEFRLSPQVEEHEFIQIPKRIELKSDQLEAHEPNLADGVDLKHLFEWGVDPAFDGIAVFCTGYKREIADGVISASQILAHTCHNYEFKLDPDSKLNMFGTETTNAGSALKSKQLDFKVRDRLPGHYLAGPRS